MKNYDSNQSVLFQAGKKLEPAQVYTAVVGIFESNKQVFERQLIIRVDYNEAARIYRQQETGKLFILYYPGTDKDLKQTLANPLEKEKIFDTDNIKQTADIGFYEGVTPNNPHPILKNVTAFVDNELVNVQKLYTTEELNKAHKLFIICEVNEHSYNSILYYFSFFIRVIRVNHFIQAEVNNQVLTFEDSINREYDLSSLKFLSQHDDSPTVIKRGWQAEWYDTWQCGYFVIEAMIRSIYGSVPPQVLTIDEKIIETHRHLYSIGSESIAAYYQAINQSMP